MLCALVQLKMVDWAISFCAQKWVSHWAVAIRERLAHYAGLGNLYDCGLAAAVADLRGQSQSATILWDCLRRIWVASPLLSHSSMHTAALNAAIPPSSNQMDCPVRRVLGPKGRWWTWSQDHLARTTTVAWYRLNLEIDVLTTLFCGGSCYLWVKHSC